MFVPGHAEVNAGAAGLFEAQPVVQRQRRVVILDMQRDAFMTGRSLRHQITNDAAADTLRSLLRNQGDIDNPQLPVAVRRLPVQTTDRLSVGFDHHEIGGGEVLLVVLVLKLELQCQEMLDFFLIPCCLRHFIGPGVGIEVAQEQQVIRGDRAKNQGWQRHRHSA